MGNWLYTIIQWNVYSSPLNILYTISFPYMHPPVKYVYEMFFMWPLTYNEICIYWWCEWHCEILQFKYVSKMCHGAYMFLYWGCKYMLVCHILMLGVCRCICVWGTNGECVWCWWGMCVLLHGEVLQGVCGMLMWGASAADGACVCSW